MRNDMMDERTKWKLELALEIFRLILMIYLLILYLIPSCINNTNVHAAHLSQQNIQQQSIQKQKSLQFEKTKEKKLQKGKRRENKVDVVVSKALEESVSKVLNLKNLKDFIINVDFTNLVTPSIVNLEQQGKGIFGVCKLISNPPNLCDIGICFELSPGLFDLTTKQYFQEKAAVQSIVSCNDVDCRKIVHLVDCAFLYAKKVSYVLFKLQDTINTVGKQQVGLQDLQKFVEVFLREEGQDQQRSIQLDTLRSTFALPCRFVDSLTTLRCGAVTISFSPFAVTVGNIKVFAPGEIAGIRASWQVSSAYSLERAYQTVKRHSKSNAQLRSVVEYIDKLESRGEVKRAAMLKQKLINQIQEGRIAISVPPNF